MRHAICIAAAWLACAAAAFCQPPDGNLRYYCKQTFGLPAYAGSGLSAPWGQGWNSPRAWDRGAEGFGRRLASSYARRLIKNTVELGVAAGTGENLRYDRAEAGGIWARTSHAVKRTFVRPGRRGGTTFAYGRVAGVYSSGFVSNLWYPAPENRFLDGLQRGSISLVADMGSNLVREFWPEIKKLLRRK